MELRLDAGPVLHKKLASVVGPSSAIEEGAQRVAAKARQRAAGHGSLPTRIKVRTSTPADDPSGRGRFAGLDRYVELHHPQLGVIEWGHTPVDWNKKKLRGRWVRGLHIMSNTFNSL